MDGQTRPVFHTLDRSAEIEISFRNLPHWFQVGAAMFVTFRTGDSLPRDVILRMQRELEEWLANRKLPLELATWTFDARPLGHERLLELLNASDRKDFRRFVDRRFHGALDDCHGECMLRRHELASIVAEAILHGDGTSYDLDSFVVMPNHVHVLVQFRTEGGLSIVGQSWMRYSARRINRALGSSGAFWQAEPFDHVIRTPEQFSYLQEYIKENPARARVPFGEFLLWERKQV
ncbi:MAG: transposase [Pirellulaceae bacterium]|nr:transposase [Pirellulaceae bacterium]